MNSEESETVASRERDTSPPGAEVSRATPPEGDALPAVRGLTVHRPWAWAIIFGGKDVENRGRATRWRGTLAVHAGLGQVEGMPAGLFPADAYDWSGHVVGLVDVIDVAPSDSPWAMTGYQHWRLANPRPLPTPVPARGLPGLWIPPMDVTARIFDQLGTADAPSTRHRTDDGDHPLPAAASPPRGSQG